MRPLMIGIILMIVSLGTARAQTVVRVQQMTLTVHAVATVESRPGETQAATIMRAAEILAAFTQRTGFEGCGNVLMNDAGSLLIELGTLNAHIGCTHPTLAHGAFTATGESVHSHPQQAWVRVNGPDRAFLNGMHRQEAFVAPETETTFSETDFTNGPGYVVTRGHLFYQRGKPWVRDLGGVRAPVLATPLRATRRP